MSCQDRAVISFAFSKPRLSLVRLELRKESVGLRAGVDLHTVLVLKLFILNIEY